VSLRLTTNGSVDECDKRKLGAIKSHYYLQIFLRRFIMNESALCYRRMSVCLSVCNEMYCDETTSATIIPFGTNMPLENRNRSAKQRG
jgi:hypothetical protein